MEVVKQKPEMIEWRHFSKLCL